MAWVSVAKAAQLKLCWSPFVVLTGRRVKKPLSRALDAAALRRIGRHPNLTAKPHEQCLFGHP